MIVIVLYILLALLVFGAIIFIHELGHFLTARACGVGVNEFAIGMGPKIFSRVSSKSGIRYSLRLLPMGGFVSMVGEDEESSADNAFGNVSVWKRMIIIVSGAAMNLLLGLLIMLVIVSSSELLPTTIVASFKDTAISDESGLMIEDRIIKVENRRVYTGYDLSYEIMNRGYKAIDLTVIRNGEKTVLENVVFNTVTESGVSLGETDFSVLGIEKNFAEVIKHTWVRSVSSVRMVWESLVGLISGRYGVDAVSGPVGMTEVIGDAARSGRNVFLHACALITINLGVINLLPVPALDGGRFVFMLIEAIRRKPVKKEVESYIHFIGIVVLFALMIAISLKDVWSIFTK